MFFLYNKAFPTEYVNILLKLAPISDTGGNKIWYILGSN